MLIDKITDEELSLIDQYRNWYAYKEDSLNKNGSFCSSKTLLQVWDEAKSDYLGRLFNGELIISKHLEFQRSYDELADEMREMFETYYVGSARIARNGSEFFDNYYAFVQSTDAFLPTYRLAACSLINPEVLAENIYHGVSFNITFPNGKVYKVMNGCKPTRVLGKIANAFGLKGFEDFRLCHSQILNQKKLSGNLVLSIHPLDYMTMSDNACDWDSCMSWANEGGYRAGTVEMMNSRCVIIAYMTEESPYRIGYNWQWNSKKWRQLFIVDPNVIIGIKAYPYQNENLTGAVVEWLRELARDNLGWTSYGELCNYDANEGFYLGNGRSMFLRLSCDAMYNDLGAAAHHAAIFNPSIPNEELEYSRWNDNVSYNIEYSGYHQCMVCGEYYDTSFDADDCLACTNCQDSRYCDCCGERIIGEYYEVDGQVLCKDCHRSECDVCYHCGEEHRTDCLTYITFLEHIDYFNKVVRHLWKMIPICNDCMPYFKESNLLKDARMIDLGECFGVFWDDLKAEAQEEFYTYRPSLHSIICEVDF